MQTCRPLSFFWTSTTVLHHALWLGHIMPESNISCRCAWTSSTNGGGFCLNYSLNRTSLVTLITCLVEWVQLSSQGSREKMSWYSARSKWAESASSGSQEPKPLNSNFLNSFSCLCSVVNFRVWLPWASSNAYIMPGHTCGSGTQLAATTLATGIFFFRVWGYTILFLTMMATLLLPLQFWCKHSVSSNLGAVVLHQHVGHESSHSTLHQWMQSSSVHVYSGWEDINHFAISCGDTSSYSVGSSTL